MEVLAVAAAVILAGEHDLAAIRIEDMGGVIDNQADLGIAQSTPLLGAAEDHVLHLAAPEGLGALFAHDPEDGVGDVGLAGAGCARLPQCACPYAPPPVVPSAC